MTTDPCPVESSSPQPHPAPELFVGIDIAKAKLDLARSDQAAHTVLTVSNDGQGIQRIVQLLLPLRPAVIAVEATGGLERPLLDALLNAGLPVALVNPRHVRDAARGLGFQAKTDAIDAHVLVEFARLARPRLAVKRGPGRDELEALVTCRRQLIEVRTEQTNRRQQTRHASALKPIDAVLKTLQTQIDNLDEQIATLIESDDDLNQPGRLLRSAPGVGPTLVATTLAELAELGAIGPRRLASLVGVAPFNHDSGRLKGKRVTRGGRASVRSTLYMATLCALRHNPVIRLFAARLKAAGKPSKVVIVAAMHKLLTLLNAMLRENLTWDQLHVVKKLNTA